MLTSPSPSVDKSNVPQAGGEEESLCPGQSGQPPPVQPSAAMQECMPNGANGCLLPQFPQLQHGDSKNEKCSEDGRSEQTGIT